MNDLVAGTAAAQGYANRLFASLGLQTDIPAVTGRHPARDWADSGLMALTGRPDGPPRMSPIPLTTCADGVLAGLRRLAPDHALSDLSGAGLLAERATLKGLRRGGRISPGGACRLLEAADGMLALNLAREADWDLLPAWLETGLVAGWLALEELVRSRQVDDLVERGRLLGLPICADRPPRREPVSWFSVASEGQPRQDACRRPLVVDLSSLWAGPLCGRLLRRLGAEVIKLESAQRPDGTRVGDPAFYACMNAGKQRVTVDWTTDRGRDELRRLLMQADIVIEASRPRALRQMGIDAEALVQERPGLTWVSITGYGRTGPQAEWVAFGDDAGVAAGLSSLLYTATDERLFCGDAIADPLTGLHAALAAWATHHAGGGRLLSVPMTDVVSHCIQHDLPCSDAALRARQQAWTDIALNKKEAA